MTTIDGIGRLAATPATKRRIGVGGFALPPELASASGSDISASGGSGPVFTASMEGLLGLQEHFPPDAVATPAARDREARRHGNALLAALAELQSLLIGTAGLSAGAPPDVRLLAGRLAGLAGSIPAAADPGLRSIVAAIGLRAQIELARRTG